ncbi:hypothetical protein KAI12_01395 [Candidatus Bathyarchaeota archaeon]|nr:hypothetical protein [Candidatus Bathyarchaeota archaeon]
MSIEKETLASLVDKIDELLTVLYRISEDLQSISVSLKSAKSLQPTTQQPQIHAEPVAEEVQTRAPSIEDVKTMFPEELAALLDFEEKGSYTIIKPRQFLGSENFAKIASTVRGMGGEYVSAGKNSHFRVSTKKT